MKYILFITIAAFYSTFALATEKMYIKRACVVKNLGVLAPQFKLQVGNNAVIETTTGADYKKVEVVAGVNTILLPGGLIQGNKAKYIYDETSPTGNIFEISVGTMIYTLRESGSSAYTGKSKVLLYIGNKKIAELQCKETDKKFTK
jgi:hypothetical protein